jgi:hypothetical protein
MIVAGVTDLKEESESENEQDIDIKDLDMLNLYVQELKEPKYVEIKKDKSPTKPCSHFNKSYLPSG